MKISLYKNSPSVEILAKFQNQKFGDFINFWSELLEWDLSEMTFKVIQSTQWTSKK